MTRPRHIWLVFGFCFFVLLTAMGWVSWTAVRLDDAQRRAARLAEQEEKVRLALWRMDSAVTPLILEESARPYQNYEPFATVRSAYRKDGKSSYTEGDVLTPSPLLTFIPEHVLLHFQFSPDGALTSPQVPTGAQRSLAEKNYLTSEGLNLASQRLEHLNQLLQQPAAPEQLTAAERPTSSSTLFRSTSAQDTSRPEVSDRQLRANRQVLLQATVDAATNTAPNPPAAPFSSTLNASPGPPVPQVRVPIQEPSPVQKPSAPMIQAQRSEAELNARANFYQQAQQRVANFNGQFANQAAFVASQVKEGLFTPLWLGEELILVRRVELEKRVLIQGCWLNWAVVKASLLSGIVDLFPLADLEPASVAQGSLLTRTLAALPAKFSTGPTPVVALPRWSPVRFSLVVSWGCILLAGGAVALLLHGTLSLSERRAAFVSAVTHELRTPLTTFKMYSEMLAAGMVPDETKRRHYLDTLCAEANRLGHLVENVLAYARLERGSARGRLENVSLDQLLHRVKERLEQRAGQAGLTLAIHGTPETLRTEVQADVSAVEQILFNLVDNACKYAAPFAQEKEKVIDLETAFGAKLVQLRVRDHGPGIPAGDQRRLFEPFHKSAHEAAHSAPGVGLGLALCRRLSRAMGGDLRLERSADPTNHGACFVLTLRLVP